MTEEKFMRRALQLARLGAGSTASNPMVGAVVVKDGNIIGEGYHKIFGGAHAEVEALYSLSGKDCENSTLYVTLEPCNHHGKTPPCTDLILQKKIPHVVVAMRDPNPVVSGKGIEQLRHHGVIVTEGLLEDEALELNKAFVKWIKTGLPYVILKWAQSHDGYMGSGEIPDKTAGRISTEETRQLVHRWRTENQAILTGRGTIEADNPKLNARYWPGNQPLRIVIDPELKITDDYRIMQDGGPTIILNTIFQGNKNNIRYIKPADMDMKTILLRLGAMGIATVMTEAGPGTLKRLIESNLWDEARVIQSKTILGKGLAAPFAGGYLTESFVHGGDQISIYRNKQ